MKTVNIPFTITPNSINVLVDGRMRTIDASHANYRSVRSILGNLDFYEDPAAELRDLLDIPSFVARVTEGRVQVSGSSVLFDGKPAHGVIVERILENLSDGFDHYVRSLARFLDRVNNNPIASAREELFIWMEHNNMPITEDGCLLAWKKVGPDYLSYHDGKTSNRIGEKMPRMDDADTDRTRTCSRGYHFCAYEYLSMYRGDAGHVMIVKIDPADVAAIPNDYNNAKGRAFTYEIVGEVPHDEAERFFEGRGVVSDYDAWPEDDDESYDSVAGLDAEDEDDNTVVGLTEDEDDDEGFYNGLEGDDPTCGCGDIEAEADANPDTDAEDEDKTFTHNGIEYSASTISDMIARNGQRGFSRLTGVARTTLQGWLKRINMN